MSADEFKAQGNEAFAAKKFDAAVELFSKAIDVSPVPNHVLYSNRSGAYSSLKDYPQALVDADECIKIKPDWAKGYNRKGAALHGLGDYAKAVEAYDEALKLDPSNAQAIQGKKSAEDAKAHSQSQSQNPLSSMFSGPQAMAKLAANPKTREYLKDPKFVSDLQKLSSDPMSLLAAGPDKQDPRLMEALNVMLGISTAGKDGEDVPMEDAPPSQSSAAKPETKSSSSSAPKAAESVSPEKAEADKKKAEANEMYKKRQFDEAIKLYNEAWETHKDITYLNNRAAAEYEKGEYDTAIKTCLLAVEESHELRSDYKLVAKALGRIGSCYLKQEKLKEAIEYFDKSLTEHRSPDVLAKLRSTQRELRIREEQAYLDPQKAEEAREEGNKYFKEGDFPASVKSYTEAIKRSPKDPRGYSNRAAAFLKLMNYPDVVQDCDKAIELDPQFFKAYTRKATALNIMKQYRKSMDTLDKARDLDTEGKHSREIEELYSKAMSQRFGYVDGENEEQRAERLSQDPEIDEIRRDPIMNTILQQAANDPAALRDHMKNPEVRRKINLLAAAGIIRTR